MRSTSDNIVAISTPSIPSSVGMLRISGFGLEPLLLGLIGKPSLKPRYAHYCDILDKQGIVIDSGIVIYFKAPYSFTGEDIIELQGHGSPVVLKLLLNRCLELGCRMAKAGEFSRRAYLNGKIDLIQAESIIDLIQAENEAAARGALNSLKGTFSKYISNINQQLIELRMFVEATLDFPEEEIEFIADAKIKDKLCNIQESIYKLLTNAQNGVLVNNGVTVVIIGQPNVGKSSLINALAGEEVAIVTDIAGTTRDIVKQKISINGVSLNIIDTAGIRSTNDIIEQIGIERAIAAMQTAQLCLVLIDTTIGITNEDKEIMEQLTPSTLRIFVHNKIDLSNQPAHRCLLDGNYHIYISAKDGSGINLLNESILEVIGFKHNPSEDMFVARTRHLEHIKNAVICLDNAFGQWHNLELLAEELRYAHNYLGEITGEFSTEELLGEIFSKFCIGK